MVGQVAQSFDSAGRQCVDADLSGCMQNVPAVRSSVEGKPDMRDGLLPFLVEEHQVAVLKVAPSTAVKGGRRPLLASVPRDVHSTEGSRKLSEATAVDAEDAFSSPQVGRSEELLGSSHDICRRT